MLVSVRVDDGLLWVTTYERRGGRLIEVARTVGPPDVMLPALACRDALLGADPDVGRQKASGTFVLGLE